MLGGMYRQAVWDRLATVWSGSEHVLELNCGTGVDAVWLAGRGHRVHATDVSPAMLDRTRAAVQASGAEQRVTTELVDLTELHRLAAPTPPFDAILSNFGGLNCVLDLGSVLQSMAALLPVGGRAVLGIMGPLVPWEWAWFLAHGQPRRAVRRLRRNPQWQGRPLRYPSVGALRRAAGPALRLERVDALGALLPPPYAEDWAQRHRTTVARLARWERNWATNPVLVRSADHYLAQLRRV